MSRIITNNLRHNDASSDNLTLDGTGNITAPGNLSVTGTSTFTGNVNVDSGTLFVDTSANRVGVGTATPAANLEVQASTVPAVQIRNTTTNSFSALQLSEVGDSSQFVINRLGSASGAIGGARAGQIWNSANAPIVFGTNDTEEMRLLAGGGLTFNGDTAAANALDDYEEGTWQPTFQGENNNNNPTITYSSRKARYTKIGRLVSLQGYIQTSAVSGTGTTILQIGNLPFTVGIDTDTDYTSSLVVGHAGNYTNSHPNGGYLRESQNGIYLTRHSGTSWEIIETNHLQNTSYIHFAIDYITSQ